MKTSMVIILGVAFFISGAAAQETQSSALVETRAIWVDKSDIYKGKEYMTQMLDALTSANFNVVCLPTMHRGYVGYRESAYLPIDPRMAEIDPDYLQWLITESHNRGLLTEAWPEYGYYSFHTPDATKITTRGPMLDKYPQLTAIDVNGTPYLHNKWGDFYSLCPANPESQEIMTGMFLEMVSKFTFDGLNLDRIRYPTNDFCFCPYCTEHFKQDTGFELSAESVKDKKVLQAFYEWRKKQLNVFMKNLSSKLRTARPDLLITADVWPPAQNQINEKGQDWGVWIKQGYIDVAIPMMYQVNIEKTVEECIQVTENPQLLMCGISAEVQDSEALANQVRTARAKGASGVVIWYLGMAVDDLEYLKENVFQTPARPYLQKNIQ